MMPKQQFYIKQSKIISQFQAVTYWLAVTMFFFTASCRQPVEPATLASRPDVEKIVVTDGYISRSISAAGGYRAWMDSIKLDFGSVVAFYKPNESFYLTENRYQIYPWSNSILISADEPQRSFTWQLSRGQFKLLKGSEQVYKFAAISTQDYAEAILNITTAPVRLLDSEYKFTSGSAPVNIAGQWYYPVERTCTALEPAETAVDSKSVKTWSKVVFYQNTETHLVDMIWFAGRTESEKSLAVRGYDYRPLQGSGVLVPTKIEIFRTNRKDVLLQRLVQIDLKQPLSAGQP